MALPVLQRVRAKSVLVVGCPFYKRRENVQGALTASSR